MTERRDRKDVLLEAGLTLASELSLPMVLQRIVDLAAEVTDARYGALGVLGEGNEPVDFLTTGMSAKQRRAIGPCRKDAGSWASSSRTSPCPDQQHCGPSAIGRVFRPITLRCTPSLVLL